jgi:hypothetical protein
MSSITAAHGSVIESGTAQSHSKYCYLFEDLARNEAKPKPVSPAQYFDQLAQLATVLDRQPTSLDNTSDVPAVYTYFGQFVNHDLSAPTATPLYSTTISERAAKLRSPGEIVAIGPDLVALMSHERPESPAWLTGSVINQHPVPLTLNSLYGAGPKGVSKDLYDLTTMEFRLAKTVDDPQFQAHQKALDLMVDDDLVRDGGIARIADRRNDENLITSQLHLAFMLFHNKAVRFLKRPNMDNQTLFQQARDLVTRHYHYCVYHDYLKQMVPDESLGSGLRMPAKGNVPFEFTTAAFRFGHSMVSIAYDFNQFFGVDGLTPNLASLGDLFTFTSHGGMNGFSQLPTHWVIDWNRFCRANKDQGSKADRIDLRLPSNLSALGDVKTHGKMEEGLSSIAHRNIKRGYHRFMPSGQEVAVKLGLPKLSPEQIKREFTDASAAWLWTSTRFDTETPLWVYLLCEAKIDGKGSKLGAVGGSLVRGTIRELLGHASDGEVWRWKPEDSPLQLPGDRPIKDIKSFLEFAGVMKPPA